jgi:phosphoglycolate phosphatase
VSLPDGLSRPRAILFDWDNTLVNTWPTIVECYHDTFTALGLPPWTADEVRERAHGSLRDLFPDLFGARAGEAERIFYETFYRIHLDRLEPLPGADTLLAGCHALGCYVEVVSNKVGENLRAELAHLGWQRWVSRAVGAKDCLRDKPAPDPIFRALDGTGIAPGETVWMVGDTPADLKCARCGLFARSRRRPEQLSGPLAEHPPRLRVRNCQRSAALLNRSAPDGTRAGKVPRSNRQSSAAGRPARAKNMSEKAQNVRCLPEPPAQNRRPSRSS